MQSQFFAGAVGVFMDIEGREKTTTLANRATAQLVHVVPHKIHGASSLTQHSCVLVSHSNLEGFGRFHIHTNQGEGGATDFQALAATPPALSISTQVQSCRCAPLFPLWMEHSALYW